MWQFKYYYYRKRRRRTASIIKYSNLNGTSNGSGTNHSSYEKRLSSDNLIEIKRKHKLEKFNSNSSKTMSSRDIFRSKNKLRRKKQKCHSISAKRPSMTPPVASTNVPIDRGSISPPPSMIDNDSYNNNNASRYNNGTNTNNTSTSTGNLAVPIGKLSPIATTSLTKIKKSNTNANSENDDNNNNNNNNGNNATDRNVVNTSSNNNVNTSTVANDSKIGNKRRSHSNQGSRVKNIVFEDEADGGGATHFILSSEEDVVIGDNHEFELQDRDQEGTPIMDIKSIVGIDGLDSVHMTNDLNLEKISSIRRGISINGDNNSANRSVSNHEYSDNNNNHNSNNNNNNSNNPRSKPTLGTHGSNTTNTTTNSDFDSQNEASPSPSPQAPSTHSSRTVMTHTSRSEDSQSTDTARSRTSGGNSDYDTGGTNDTDHDVDTNANTNTNANSGNNGNFNYFKRKFQPKMKHRRNNNRAKLSSRSVDGIKINGDSTKTAQGVKNIEKKLEKQLLKQRNIASAGAVAVAVTQEIVANAPNLSKKKKQKNKNKHKNKKPNTKKKIDNHYKERNNIIMNSNLNVGHHDHTNSNSENENISKKGDGAHSSDKSKDELSMNTLSRPQSTREHSIFSELDTPIPDSPMPNISTSNINNNFFQQNAAKTVKRSVILIQPTKLMTNTKNVSADSKFKFHRKYSNSSNPARTSITTATTTVAETLANATQTAMTTMTTMTSARTDTTVPTMVTASTGTISETPTTTTATSSTTARGIGDINPLRTSTMASQITNSDHDGVIIEEEEEDDVIDKMQIDRNILKGVLEDTSHVRIDLLQASMASVSTDNDCDGDLDVDMDRELGDSFNNYKRKMVKKNEQDRGKIKLVNNESNISITVEFIDDHGENTYNDISNFHHNHNHNSPNRNGGAGNAGGGNGNGSSKKMAEDSPSMEPNAADVLGLQSHVISNTNTNTEYIESINKRIDFGVSSQGDNDDNYIGAGGGSGGGGHSHDHDHHNESDTDWSSTNTYASSDASRTRASLVFMAANSDARTKEISNAVEFLLSLPWKGLPLTEFIEMESRYDQACFLFDKYIAMNAYEAVNISGINSDEIEANMRRLTLWHLAHHHKNNNSDNKQNSDERDNSSNLATPKNNSPQSVIHKKSPSSLSPNANANGKTNMKIGNVKKGKYAKTLSSTFDEPPINSFGSKQGSGINTSNNTIKSEIEFNERMYQLFDCAVPDVIDNLESALSRFQMTREFLLLKAYKMKKRKKQAARASRSYKRPSKSKSKSKSTSIFHKKSKLSRSSVTRNSATNNSFVE